MEGVRKLEDSTNMSVYSARTGLSSILKPYSPMEREKAKIVALNKVRFQMPKEHGLLGAIEPALTLNDFTKYNAFVSYLRDTSLTEPEIQRIIIETRQSISNLTPKLSYLIEAILSLDWQDWNDAMIKDYMELTIELLVAHTRYVEFGISQLISRWVPSDKLEDDWPKGIPSEKARKPLKIVHKVIQRLLTIMPMSFDVVLNQIERFFPYWKKPSHVVAGYIHNVLWLLEYKPISCSFIFNLLLKKLLILDASASRSDIEDAEYEDESDADMENDGGVFPIDMDDESVEKTMKLPIAETLDLCLEKVFVFLESMLKSSRKENLENSTQNRMVHHIDTALGFKLLLSAFDDVILPSHNTHHVQFLLFYYCNSKPIFAEKFLAELWSKLLNPNVSAIIRQSSVGYIASFLARSKYISRNTIFNYLSEMSKWVHQYIDRSDTVRTNCSLKANSVFFSVCQAIFYVIAFRSRELTNDKKGLLFLQSLQLSGIVGCNYNPLRVCLPAVATAFAGVTRAYQLAYCHAILERNARRRLATVYANEVSTPEESLETFFPFDPYLLKKSNRFVEPLYQQYQASDAEENEPELRSPRRKRKDSEMAGDDVDDFLVDKRQRLCDISKSHEKEMQFTYGLSPGFHI